MTSLNVKPSITTGKLSPETTSQWQEILVLLKRIAGAEGVQLSYFRDDSHQLLLSDQPASHSFPGSPGLVDTDAFCRHVAESDQPLYVSDSRADAHWRQVVGLSGEITAYLGVPLHQPNGELLAVLSLLTKRPHPFDSDMQALVIKMRDLMAAQLALAAQSSQLASAEAQLRALLVQEPANSSCLESDARDPVTGLLERNSFYSGIRQHLEPHLDQQQPLCVMMFDVDYYHTLLAKYGTDTGNLVLGEIGARLRSGLSHQDLAWRWGDDQFLLLLPGVEQRRGCEFAEKLRKSICDLPITAGSLSLQVTISAGVTLLAPKESIESAVLRADQLRYEGKDLGRNAVIADNKSPCPVRGMCSAGQRVGCVFN